MTTYTCVCCAVMIRAMIIQNTHQQCMKDAVTTRVRNFYSKILFNLHDYLMYANQMA